MNNPTMNSYMGINMIIHGSKASKYEEEPYVNVLGGGFSSRMFMEIRDKRNLSYSTFMMGSLFRDFGLVSAIMDVKPERCPEALEVTLKLMKDALENPIPQDELNRALKAAQQTALFVSDSSTNYTHFVMSKVLSDEEYDLEKINKNLKESVNLEWQAKMQEFWKKENFSLAIAGDSGETENVWQEKVEEVM